jgi:hypothetical protein
MSNPTKFGSNWCSGFKEDKQKRQHPVLNLWASCFFRVFLINKNIYINFLEDHPMNIPTK